MNFAVLDRETFLMQPSVLAPRSVSLVVDVQGDELIHSHFDRQTDRDRSYRAFAERPVGANLAFDAAVTLVEFPELTETLWDAYDQFRAWDVLVAEKLIDLAKGQLRWHVGPQGPVRVGYSLGEIVQRRFGHEMKKDDGVRMRFGTLAGVPIEAWPANAREYAVEDLAWTRRVLQDQLREPQECLVDVARQTRHAWWIALMTNRGFFVSKERVDRFESTVSTELHEIGQRLRAAGLVSSKDTRDTKAAAAYLTHVLAQKGLEPKRTPNGKVELTEEQCLDSGDPLLADYARYSGRVSMLAKARALKDPADARMPVQSRFEVLLETGRTACSGGKAKKKDVLNRIAYEFQLQNLPRETGLRECFVPRPGYVLGSLDYSQLELCTWAQVCYFLFGWSRLGEAINSGKDVHCLLAARFVGQTYEDVYAGRKSIWKDARQSAKIPNFSLPGGMGARGLVGVAKSQYGQVWTEDYAREVIKHWREEWPEEKPYFKFIRHCIGERYGSIGTVVQLQSQRVRGGADLTSGSNSLFQGLAADTAKAAMYECARACYTGRDSHGKRCPALHGSYLVDFVHDEGIFEFIADRAHEAALEAKEIMDRVGKEWCPHVSPTVEPALMLEWTKEAEPKYENGRLVPWRKSA